MANLLVYASILTPTAFTRNQWLNGSAVFLAHPAIVQINKRAESIDQKVQIIIKVEGTKKATRSLLSFRVPKKQLKTFRNYIENRLGRPIEGVSADVGQVLGMMIADAGFNAQVEVIEINERYKVTAIMARTHLTDNSTAYYG